VPSRPVDPKGSQVAEQRAWWAPLPFPELPSISTRRAYAEVLGVWAAFFLTGVIAAGLLLADRYRDVLTDAGWALYLTQTVGILVEIGLAVAVVLLLCERRSVTPAILGLRWPRLDDGRFAFVRTARILAWAFLAQVLGGIVNSLLQTGHLPTERSSNPEIVFAVADSIQAGVIEELVVLGFVVVTLRQAGRPMWEVCAVALVLRGSYHIYYGPGVAGILLWAAMFLWIYLRTGSLFPLMLSHMVWDAVAFLSQRWAAVAGVAILGLVVLWIAAPITWLVERNRHPGPPVAYPGGAAGGSGHRAPQAAVGSGAPWAGPAASARLPALPPPGWHPDPGGANRWRWWDGQRWTEHVSSHDDGTRSSAQPDDRGGGSPLGGPAG
jgi:hypothetical protein